MKLYYGDWFYVGIDAYNPKFKDVERRTEGYDITPKTVMYMLSAACDCAKQKGGDLQSALAQLSIRHRFMVFRGPEQNRPNFSDTAQPNYCIVFGKERVTQDNLYNRVKTIPMYTDYKIKQNIFSRPNTGKNYSIESVNLSDRKMFLTNADGNTIVVDPDNFKVMNSDLPGLGGDLLPVLEKIMTPVQFILIPPVRREEFFGKNR